MKVVHLFDEYEQYKQYGDNAVLLVSDYHIGYYDGSGDSLELGEDGKVRHRCLSHCSCYGPGEACVEQSWDNVAEFILAQDSIHGFSGKQQLVDAFINEVYQLGWKRD